MLTKRDEYVIRIPYFQSFKRDVMYKTIFILVIIMFTPLESHSIYDGNGITNGNSYFLVRSEFKPPASLREAGQAPPFLTGFSQEDRERLIRLETKVEEGQKSLQRQIDNLYALILWGFGILFGGMGLLIGFVIWDRRTALAPAIRKNKELEEREELIEKALKEYARENPKFAEILKGFGII